MTALAGPYFMFATLLLASGIPKLSRPENTTRALESIGLPPNRNVGRAVGVVEIAVALTVIAVGGRLPAMAMAVLYAGFAGFILFGMRSTAVSSCGCFGDEDTAPNGLHLAVDLTATAVAAAVAVRPLSHLAGVMADTPAWGAPLLLLILIGTWLALLALTLLPAIGAVRREASAA